MGRLLGMAVSVPDAASDDGRRALYRAIGELGEDGRTECSEACFGGARGGPPLPAAWTRRTGFLASRRLEPSLLPMGLRHAHRVAQAPRPARQRHRGGSSQGVGLGRVVRGAGLRPRRAAPADVRGGLSKPVSQRRPSGKPFPGIQPERTGWPACAPRASSCLGHLRASRCGPADARRGAVPRPGSHASEPDSRAVGSGQGRS